MTFPRFNLKTADDVPPEVQERRAQFAAGPLAKRISSHADDDPDGLAYQRQNWPMPTPEAQAEAFGRDMFARCGKDWPRMIGLASGAAMNAERDAMGDVK